MKRIFLIITLVACALICATAHPKTTEHIAYALRTDSIMPEDSVQADTVIDNIREEESLRARVTKLLDNDIFERTQVGLYIYDLTADTLVIAYRPSCSNLSRWAR